MLGKPCPVPQDNMMLSGVKLLLVLLGNTVMTRVWALGTLTCYTFRVTIWQNISCSPWFISVSLGYRRNEENFSILRTRLVTRNIGCSF